MLQIRNPGQDMENPTDVFCLHLQEQLQISNIINQFLNSIQKPLFPDTIFS